MIEVVLQCLIAGHKEIGPSLFETDLLCPSIGLVLTYQSKEKDAKSTIALGTDRKGDPLVFGHMSLKF
jgi:hypothetical protein